MFGIIKGLQAKIILILGLIVPVMGYALYHQIQANGALKAERNQLESAVKSSQSAIKRLQEQQALNEVVVLRTAGRREIIERETENIRWRTREIIREAPAGDCLVSPVDDSIDKLLREASNHRAGGAEGVPTNDSDPVESSS